MSERTRDERCDDYCEEWSARLLADRLVDAEDEAARLRLAWKSARGRADMYFRGWRGARWRAGLYREASRKDGAALRETLDVLGVRSTEVRRYRSAWLSARRRAADSFMYGAEALAMRDEEIARLRAEVADLRKAPYGATGLVCMGTEDDGSTVWVAAPERSSEAS
ncbi:hypothetical protein AB0N28_03620 [Streptomyces sp. NPDC051130]|uniref:hypothetical protein n=1 Tax=Streptomyces sp. NPDC051130 TaxID=3157223 RepID=UPI00343DF1C5